MTRRPDALLVGLVLLALAVFLGSLFIGHGIRDRGRNDVITVTGSAKKRIGADYVVWSPAVTVEGGSASASVADIGRWARKVHAFLHDEGVKESELTIQPISIETITPEDTGDSGVGILGYRLTRTFTIRSNRVDAIRRVAQATTKLLAKNIPLTGDPPQYVYTKLPSLRPELLREAMRDAQERAKVLVDATGAKLGGLRSVDVGVFQVTAPNSTEVSDYGEYDTSTRLKDVTAVVNVTFALD
jgi:uncharacterized protein